MDYKRENNNLKSPCIFCTTQFRISTKNILVKVTCGIPQSVQANDVKIYQDYILRRCYQSFIVVRTEDGMAGQARRILLPEMR
jgi:hypothetical protein